MYFTVSRVSFGSKLNQLSQWDEKNSEGTFLTLILMPFYFRQLFSVLKGVAFIAGKSENQAAKNFFIHFFLDNLIANISLLSWPKLNFGCYLTFEIIF